MEVINFSESDSLLNFFVREIRDITIQNDRLRFRRNIERIGEVMAYEISKHLTYSAVEITTPLDITKRASKIHRLCSNQYRCFSVFAGTFNEIWRKSINKIRAYECRDDSLQ